MSKSLSTHYSGRDAAGCQSFALHTGRSAATLSNIRIAAKMMGVPEAGWSRIMKTTTVRDVSPWEPVEDKMPELKSAFLGELRIVVAGSHIFGATPAGQMRRIDYFETGSFKGPRIDATIIKGSADMLLRRFDGVIQPDVRLTLGGDDGSHILVQYRGYRHAPEAVMERIADGEIVPPSEYYLRTAVFFETDSEKYAWLNRTVAVGVGRREPDAAVYDVFEIL